VITIIAPFILIMRQSSEPKPTYLKYSPVTGYFEQDDPETDPRGYDFVGAMTCQFEKILIVFRPAITSV
jgi:hypothetical protein